MRCCKLFRCRVEIDIVRQTCVSPLVGVSVPLVAVARRCIDGNPASVHIALIPPVVKFGNILFGRPCVKTTVVQADVVSVYDSGRNALCSGKRTYLSLIHI